MSVNPNWTREELVQRIESLESDMQRDQVLMKTLREVAETVVAKNGEAVSGANRWCIFCGALTHGTTLTHTAGCVILAADDALHTPRR